MPHRENRLIALVRTAPRRRVLLTLASVVVAIFLGFIAFSPPQAQAVVHDYGYYLIIATFIWLVLSLVGVWREVRLAPGFVRSDPWWSGWFRRRSLMDGVLAKDDCGRRIPPGAYAQGTL